MNIVILGNVFDMSDPESPTKLPGYHVDSISPIAGADDFLVTPKTPRHKFSGVSESYRYRSNSKQHAESFLPREV